MIRADCGIKAGGEITIADKNYKIFAGLYDADNSYIGCTKLNAEIGYGRLELIEPKDKENAEDEEEMVEIDGKKISKETIKEALKDYLNL